MAVTHVRHFFHCENRVDGEELILELHHRSDEKKITALHIPMWLVPYLVRHLSQGVRKYCANAERIVARLETEAKEPSP